MAAPFRLTTCERAGPADRPPYRCMLQRLACQPILRHVHVPRCAASRRCSCTPSVRTAGAASGSCPLPPSTSPGTWYLADGGRLLDDPGGNSQAAYDYDPLGPVPTVGGATMMHGFRPGPADQRRIEARDDVLTFTSDPVTAPLTLFGEVRTTFHASSSAPDTDFVVRLCKVSRDGVSIGLNDGIVRASWRDSYATGTYRPGHRPTPLEPGQVYEFAVSLWSIACTLAPGERLRIQVTSSCHPR